MTMQDSSNPVLSLVVPFFNEKESLVAFHKEVQEIFSQLPVSYEIIYVDDGSSDGSEKVFAQLSGCSVVRLRRSFGQTAALIAGFDLSRGSYIATLDGDLQNDPRDLLAMFDSLSHDPDVDMLIGWRKFRKDGVSKKLPSYIAFMLRQFLLNDGIHDAGCGVKMFRREVLRDLELYGEMHRFFVSIVKSRGYRVLEVEVNHRPRSYGYSKYSWKRGIKGFLDMIAVWFWGNFSVRPLHLLGGLGLLVIGSGVVSFLLTLFHVFPGDNNRLIASALMFILGIQLLVSGLIADIAVRTYYAARDKKVYSVKNITQNK